MNNNSGAFFNYDVIFVDDLSLKLLGIEKKNKKELQFNIIMKEIVWKFCSMDQEYITKILLQ